MAPYGLLCTPPLKDAILKSLLEGFHAYHKLPPLLGLRECHLDAEMPFLLNPYYAPVPCWESLAEFQAINDHFSAQVHAFFDALHELEDMSEKQSPDKPNFVRQDDGLWLIIRVVNQSYDIYPVCWHRFQSRRLTVRNPESLPLLSRVTQLRVLPKRTCRDSPGMEFIHQRPISPSVPFELATRLPSLRELDCPCLWERLPLAYSSKALLELAREWEGPWRDARVEFVRAVLYAMPLLSSSLTKVRIWFWKPNPYGDEADQASQMPDLIGAPSSASPISEIEGLDPVSIGLRRLGSCLEEFDIRALITPDVFPSSKAGVTGHPSSWPNMRYFKIEFHPCAPDGRWYFSGPRGEDPHATGFAITQEEHYPPGREDADKLHALLSDEEDENDSGDELCLLRQTDMFRILPIRERIEPLLLAFASSLQRKDMPSLEGAELFTWLTWRPSEERAREYEGSDDAPALIEDETILFRWGVRYDAPQGDKTGKVTWQVGKNWRPGDEIMRVFKDLVGGYGETMEWKAFEFVEERDFDSIDFG